MALAPWVGTLLDSLAELLGLSCPFGPFAWGHQPKNLPFLLVTDSDLLKMLAGIVNSNN